MHTVGQNAFSGCKNLNNVKIADGVSSIGDYAFLQCSCINLKSITIPEKTTYIGKEAFIECTDLKSVTIPKSVKEIGENALGICFDDDGAIKKVPGFKIKCYSGTAAEKYAIEHGVDYETFDRSAVKVGTVKTAGFVCSDTAIKINWERVANASGYRIYRYDTLTKTWNTVATVSGGNKLSYKHTGRKSGTTYKYKVKAYRKLGDDYYRSEASEVKICTTK